MRLLDEMVSWARETSRLSTELRVDLSGTVDA